MVKNNAKKWNWKSHLIFAHEYDMGLSALFKFDFSPFFVTFTVPERQVK